MERQPRLRLLRERDDQRMEINMNAECAYAVVVDQKYWDLFDLWLRHFLLSEPQYPLVVIELSALHSWQRALLSERSICSVVCSHEGQLPRIHLADWARAALPRWFPMYKQFLYMDVDAVVRRNLDHLFSLPPCDFAATVDWWRDTAPYRQLGVLKGTSPYFNIGVLLIRRDVSEKLATVMTTQADWDTGQWCYGEWCWNYVLQQSRYEVSILPNIYNWHHHRSQEIHLSEDVMVYHYSSPQGKVQMRRNLPPLGTAFGAERGPNVSNTDS